MWDVGKSNEEDGGGLCLLGKESAAAGLRVLGKYLLGLLSVG